MIVVILLLTIIIISLQVFIKIKYSHWSKQGVRGPTPLPFFGNFARLMMQKQSMGHLAETIYKQFPEEKVVGMYCGFTPALLIRDLEIINHVMTTDFNNFMNRGFKTADKGFCDNLLIAEGDIWRSTRQKLSPAFTNNKLKQMIPLITEAITKFINQVDLAVKVDENCDMKKLASRYAMELICSCGFGLNFDFYSDNKMKELMRIGKECVTPSLSCRLWYVAEMLLPGIQSILPTIDPTAQNRIFLNKLVSQVISERKKSKDKRHDIMEVMIKLLDEERNKHDAAKRNGELKVDVNFITSQIYILFVTAYDTSSFTLSLLLHELAEHKHYQETAYKEISNVLEKHNGELTYDSVNEMTYLRKVLNETLRRHSLASWIIRRASKDCILPGSNVKVNAGTIIFVSTNGLHGDPKYFHDPGVFNPENFSTENMNKIPQNAFIPFGIGPRQCIGYRFAIHHIMMVAAAFLRKFKVSPCTDEQRKVKFDSISLTLSPVDGVWIKVSKRN